jgi:hypothetical protein
MTQPKRENYQAAQDRITAGKWWVNPLAGFVYGTKGQPFRRTNTDGYIQIKFRDAEDWRTERAVLAHRVIWEYMHGELEAGLTINHLNGVKTDNRMVNLEAVTQMENNQHAWRAGLATARRGEDASNSRLTDSQVLEIYRRAWTGEYQPTIAADYGVGREIVSNIKQGHAWTHVTGHSRTAS